MKLKALFAPAAHRQPLPDGEVDASYKKLRLQVFLGIFIGYAGYYLVRKNFSMAMPDLIEQGYSKGEGIFGPGYSMRLLLRDLNDPFDIGPRHRSGGINVIDLGNIDSCAFIETKDIGRMQEDGSFEVLGRFDNSDIRGCNLLVV